ncbi:MAG: hypothetical protein QNK11_06625 [Legionella sp.]|nr:hypothetical protein [Legionella sp.]
MSVRFFGYTGLYVNHAWAFPPDDFLPEKEPEFGARYKSWKDPLYRMGTIVTDPIVLLLEALAFIPLMIATGLGGLCVDVDSELNPLSQVYFSSVCYCAFAAIISPIVNALDLLVGGGVTLFDALAEVAEVTKSKINGLGF